MGSRVDTDEDNDNRGSMWDLDQKLDQPMDEEAGRLRNMYREKVWCLIATWFYSLSLSLAEFVFCHYCYYWGGKCNSLILIMVLNLYID